MNNQAYLQTQNLMYCYGKESITPEEEYHSQNIIMGDISKVCKNFKEIFKSSGKLIYEHLLVEGNPLTFDIYTQINYLETYCIVTQPYEIRKYLIKNKFLIDYLWKALGDIYKTVGVVPVYLELHDNSDGGSQLHLVVVSNSIEALDELEYLANRHNRHKLKIVPEYDWDYLIYEVRNGTVNELLDKMSAEFKNILESTESYWKLSEELQKAGLVVALISFVEFNGNVKSIILKMGDDEYPEIRINPRYDISSDELINRVNNISDKVWNLSSKDDSLLTASILIDR